MMCIYLICPKRLKCFLASINLKKIQPPTIKLLKYDINSLTQKGSLVVNVNLHISESDSLR